MKRFKVEIAGGRFKIFGFVQVMGKDLLVSIQGGTHPHIGAIGIAIPRPSLRDPQRWSATSSNFTLSGHKEDILVKKLSEKLASRLRTQVVVTAGLHWDNLSSREIRVVEKLAMKMADLILKKLLP